MKRSPMELKTGIDLREKRMTATTRGVPMSTKAHIAREP